MNPVVKVIVEKVHGVFEQVARQRAAKQLLLLTDKQLDDVGLSRQKLERGAAAYPWKLVEEVLAPVKTAAITNLHAERSSKVSHENRASEAAAA